VPGDIRYPTDLSLLNEGREKLEEIIDTLHADRPKGATKPRTYRQRARKDFLTVIKKRRASTNKIRKAIRKQLGYLRRNLRHIEQLAAGVGLKSLSRQQYRNLLVTSEVFRQQALMYEAKHHRMSGRIVSISQPHIRPIVRGKAGTPVEFGMKISSANIDGYLFIDRCSWDPYNESGDLVMQAEKYKQRYGVYPESIHADQIYIKYTQDNALKGLRFESLEHQNAHLRTWNKTWARTRIHGTTKQQVWQMFLTERETLQPLPDSRFQFFKIGQRTVHADGHIEIQKSYYSVPYTFIGKRVTVHFNSDWVKVFIPLQGVPTMIAFHKATGAGRYQTSNKHIPEHKIFTNASYTQYLQKKSREIGEGCAKWVEKTLTERAQQAYRPIQGVFRLLDRYSQETVNRACIKALIQHSYRYHTVHLMCQDTESENQEDLMTTEHEIIRPPSEYGQYIERLSLRR
jgi:hypothetical protein